MKTYAPADFMSIATCDHGDTYWIEADGTDVEVTIPRGEPCRNYGMRGTGQGSITVDGAGHGDARRYGAGHGNAVRDGEGRGNAVRDGAGHGDAIRIGKGRGIETDARGARTRVAANGIGYPCLAGNGYLRVGCEIYPIAYWIAHAAEIDNRHGDGIAAITKALAERLRGVEPDQ